MSDFIEAGEYLGDLLKKQSRDAYSWAHATTLALHQYSGVSIDQEYLHTIFANAMMSMHDSIYNNEIQSLQSQLKKAEEVLSWYADPQNQIAPIYKPTGKPGADFTQPFRMDKGYRAQQYFKNKENKDEQ